MEWLMDFWQHTLLPRLDTLLGQIFWTAVIVVASYIVLRLIRRLIARLFQTTRIDEQKEKTLAALLNSAARYTIYAVAIFMVLRVFNVDITPLLAGVGIAGLAIGFGAQNLVKDLITGFFVLFEDQFHVGDFVEINGTVTGTIEELGLRTTTVREWSGKKFYIANSEIKTVRNYNRDHLRVIVTATFPFEEDPREVREALEAVCAEATSRYHDDFLADDLGRLVEPPQIYGVTDIDQNERGARFTIIALTKPASLWTVEKGLRELIWQECYRRGLRLAYPRRVYEGYLPGTPRLDYLPATNPEPGGPPPDDAQ